MVFINGLVCIYRVPFQDSNLFSRTLERRLGPAETALRIGSKGGLMKSDGMEDVYTPGAETRTRYAAITRNACHAVDVAPHYVFSPAFYSLTLTK